MYPFHKCTFIDLADFNRVSSLLLITQIPVRHARQTIVQHLARLSIGSTYNVPGRMLTESSVLIWCQHPTYSIAINRVVRAISKYSDEVNDLDDYYNALQGLTLAVHSHTEVLVPPVYDRTQIHKTFGV